jgi:hypothetical protein
VKSFVKQAALAAAIFVAMAPAALAGTTPAPSLAAEAEPTYVPFDPPLGQPIRYRFEKTETKDAKSQISWEVMDFTFEEAEGGYRLTVSTVDSGSNETDPVRLAIERDLAELTKAPLKLRLDEEGSITEMEDMDRYWATIFEAISKAIEKGKDGKPATPETKQALSAYLTSMRDLPSDKRLFLLTMPIQPAMEFAETEMTVGKPIHHEVEQTTPFGAVIKLPTYLNLTGLRDGIASYSFVANLPKEDAMAAIKALFAKLGVGTVEGRAKFEEAMAKMDYKQEGRALYRVDAATGLTESFEATETIEVVAEGSTNRRVTASSLKRIS